MLTRGEIQKVREHDAALDRVRVLEGLATTALSAEAASSRATQYENLMAAEIIRLFNIEIQESIHLWKPGEEFPVTIDKRVMIEGTEHVPNATILSIVADVYRNNGWDVKEARNGMDHGSTMLRLVRPLRDEIPKIDAEALDSAES